MTLHLTPDEWAPIEAAGSGTVFRAGDIAAPSLDDKSTWQDIPPAEFVEAAQVCETCGGRWEAGDHGWDPIKREWVDIVCPDCLDGKRRVAVVVPAFYDHDPDQPIGDRHVGHVVVTWGPLVVVLYEEWELGGDHPECVAIDRWDSAIRLEERKGDDDCYAWSVDPLPDIDPQSLVGQYAIGVEVVR